MILRMTEKTRVTMLKVMHGAKYSNVKSERQAARCMFIINEIEWGGVDPNE